MGLIYIRLLLRIYEMDCVSCVSWLASKSPSTYIEVWKVDTSWPRPANWRLSISIQQQQHSISRPGIQQVYIRLDQIAILCLYWLDSCLISWCAVIHTQGGKEQLVIIQSRSLSSSILRPPKTTVAKTTRAIYPICISQGGIISNRLDQSDGISCLTLPFLFDPIKQLVRRNQSWATTTAASLYRYSAL